MTKALTANPIFGEAWGEFTECLIFPQEPDKPLQISRDAAEYFHSSAVIDRHLSIRYYNSVTNILTGLGILGTFIGLAAGISLAQAGLREDDIQLMHLAPREMHRSPARLQLDTGSGTRTRKGVSPEVFETSASTDSAIPAHWHGPIHRATIGIFAPWRFWDKPRLGGPARGANFSVGSE